MPVVIPNPALYQEPPDNVETCSSCGSVNIEIHHKHGSVFLRCLDCGASELLD